MERAQEQSGTTGVHDEMQEDDFAKVTVLSKFKRLSTMKVFSLSKIKKITVTNALATAANVY